MGYLVKLCVLSVFFFVSLTLSLLPTWLMLSAVTSGVKVLSDDCGKRYPVEAVLGGDWFCAEGDNDN